MCIVAFAWKAHPRWQMVAIGNRGELHARPAESLHRWETYDHLLAGRDAIAGGTWLGVSEEGRFAVVTIYMVLARRNPNGRLAATF